LNRIFLDLELVSGSEIELSDELSHHLRDVLRLKEGNQLIAVSNLDSEEYLAIVTDSGLGNQRQSHPLEIKILSQLPKRKLSSVVSSLICAIPKGSHSDQICEQVSQLGVDRIIFWQADRSVQKLSNPDSKLERWRKIVEASARQSCGLKIPEVLYLASTHALVRLLSDSVLGVGDMLAVCSLSENAKMPTKLQVVQARVHLLVGPEGDFSASEQEEFLKLGAIELSLGAHVLRVETAAVVAVAMIKAVWD
jgi:16S rRNA (uracil1498-N3)-methyltransferase